MLETIVSWISVVVGELLELVVNIMMSNLVLDLDVIIATFPALASAYPILQHVALGLVIVIAGYQMVLYTTGNLGEQKDRPVETLIFALFATGMIFFGGHILTILIDLSRTPYEAMLQLESVQIPFTFTNFDVTALFVTGGAGIVLGAGTVIVFTLIVILLIGWNLIKLLLEVYERYIVVGLIAYSSPLAFCTMASRHTSVIAKKWWSMFFSSLVMMFLSAWSVRIILSGFNFSDVGSNFYRLLLTWAACKVALKMDVYLQQIGLNTATTGSGMMADVLTVAVTMSRLGGGRSKGGKDSTLGADVAKESKGSPLAFSGLFGGATGAMRQGMEAYKAGEDKSGIINQAVQGAKSGFTEGYAITKNMRKQINDMKAARAQTSGGKESGAGSQDTPSSGGEAENQPKDAGGINVDRSGTPTLNDVAKNAGIEWDGGKDSRGNPTAFKGPEKAVGQHIAQNYDKSTAHPSYQQSMLETVKQRPPAVAEHALMKSDQELSGNDRLGATMMDKAFGDGISDAFSEKDATGNYTDMTEFQSALEMTGQGVSGQNGESVSNIVAKTAHGGRSVSCNYTAASGRQYKVETMDAKAYKASGSEVQSGMRAIKSSSGSTYYTKAEEVQQKTADEMI